MMGHPNIVNFRPVISGVGTSHDLVEALCSTQTRGASANDKDVDVSVVCMSVKVSFCKVRVSSR